MYNSLLVFDRSVEEQSNILSADLAARWNITAVSTASEATIACAEQQFNILLLEADPLDPDCIETISGIRNDGGLSSNAIIIANAWFAPGEFANFLIASGADLFVKKPIFSTSVERLIHEARARRSGLSDTLGTDAAL